MTKKSFVKQAEGQTIYKTRPKGRQLSLKNPSQEGQTHLKFLEVKIYFLKTYYNTDKHINIAYPSEATFKCSTLGLTLGLAYKNRREWKGLPRTNTLAGSKTFSITKFRIMTLIIEGLFATPSINDIQHNNTSAIMLRVITLNVAFYLLLR